MWLYKLVFSKGYSFSLKMGFANSPGNAANHMHLLMTVFIAINVLTATTFFAILFFGISGGKSFLSDAVVWTVIFALAYGFVYIYFIYKKEYILTAKTFYEQSKFRGKSGTLIAILYLLVSLILFVIEIFIISKEKIL